jgi:hypothetical protein
VVARFTKTSMMTTPTAREVMQERVRKALARMAAAPTQAATLASAGQVDDAVEATRLATP